jgi:arylsulfatase A-like enzyme
MSKSQSSRPNVIVFFSDQQRWDTMSVYGNPLGLTPNLDRMAREGTHAYNAYTCQPVCGPARSCFQTGLYATTSGCYRNGIIPPKGSKMLAHYFNDAGYKTGYIGKWHLGSNASKGAVVPEERGGYQYWLAANALEHTSDAYDAVVYDNDNRAVKLPGYRVDALTDAAIRYIDQNQKNPFFLFLSHLEPHHQNHIDSYPAPTGYEEMYQGRWTPPDLAALGGSTHQHLAGYWGMTKRLDEAYGRMLDALKSLKLDENTVVLYTTDHGSHFKTRNGEYKRSCHESSTRIPAVFSGGPFRQGRQLREMISLIDFPPTLLDAAGIPAPPQMQGRSILPLVRGEKVDWPEEAFIQISESHVGRAIRTKKWKYSVTGQGDLTGKGSAETYQEDFLYDLQHDPYELTNLIEVKSHRETAEVLRQRLLKRIKQCGEAEPVILPPAEEKPARQRLVTTEEAHS